jgi:threonine/homoserine/homoserine lactone efflux protein
LLLAYMTLLFPSPQLLGLVYLLFLIWKDLFQGAHKEAQDPEG